MAYELYYWPTIQGRGEFIRLALEAAGADYVDVARGAEKDGQGVKALMRLMTGAQVAHPPFAPPFLRDGEMLIGQSANVLLYLGRRLLLAPQDEAGQLWLHQIQLTIADFVDDAHDTHHPLGSSMYYEEQKAEAATRSANFLSERAPKHLGWLERVLQRNPAASGFLVGDRLSYADLSAFQMVAGLRYAFPRGMARLEADVPLLVALHDRVSAMPRVAAYLTSPRRIAFNEQGIFRCYPELDAPA
jgi:glutathione S-transferase